MESGTKSPCIFIEILVNDNSICQSDSGVPKPLDYLH